MQYKLAAVLWNITNHIKSEFFCKNSATFCLQKRFIYERQKRKSPQGFPTTLGASKIKTDNGNTAINQFSAFILSEIFRLVNRAFLCRFL